MSADHGLKEFELQPDMIYVLREGDLVSWQIAEIKKYGTLLTQDSLKQLSDDLQAFEKSMISQVILPAEVLRNWDEHGALITTRSQQERQPGRIYRPPGHLLSAFADFFCSPKTVERVLAPIISDLQVEYVEALAAGRTVKARWVRARGYWAFFKAVALYSLLKALVDVWRKLSAG